jgi:hypothetical protein
LPVATFGRSFAAACNRGGVVLLWLALLPSTASAASLLVPDYGDQTLATAAPDQPSWTPVADGDAPFYAVDWSVGLRGAYVEDSSGSRFETLLLPSATLTHTGDRLSFSSGASAEISRTGDGAPSVDTLRLKAGNTLSFNPDSSLATNANLAMTRENPHNPDVAANVAETPVEVSGTVDGTFTRKFGRFNLALRGNAERDVFGPTTFTDSSTEDNAPQNNTEARGGLRVGYALTPILEPFIDAGVARSVFDAPSTSLGVKLDGNTYTVKAGVSAKWDTLLEAEASIGLGLERFDDATLADVRATLYDASLTYRPSDTLTVSGDFSTSIGAPGPNGGGSAKIDYGATAKADYKVNEWLNWRASAAWHSASYAQSSTADNGYDLGVGADYSLSKHAKLSADYDFSHSEITPNPATDSHTVTLGMTLQK